MKLGVENINLKIRKGRTVLYFTCIPSFFPLPRYAIVLSKKEQRSFLMGYKFGEVGGREHKFQNHNR